MDEESLTQLLNVSDNTHRRALMFAINRLKHEGVKVPSSLWEFKVIQHHLVATEAVVMTAVCVIAFRESVFSYSGRMICFQLIWVRGQPNFIKWLQIILRIVFKLLGKEG